ncbi:hypothetical protein JUNP499_0755 [Acinetobacter baumannii]
MLPIIKNLVFSFLESNQFKSYINLTYSFKLGGNSKFNTVVNFIIKQTCRDMKK